MSFTEKFRYTAGQTDLYAFPASSSYAFSGWATHRVLCTEIAPGLYSATMDETKSYEWSVFDGATAPTTHDDAIVAIAYEPPAVTTGTGARTVTITVQLASVNVQGARVRISKDAETFTGETNSSGQVVFNVNDGSWAVAITNPGTSFAGATLVVDGAETATYALTALSTTPPTAPDRSTGSVLCIDAFGSPAPGTDLSFKLIKGPGSSGRTYNNPEFYGRSNSSGVVEINTFIRLATYRYWRTGKPESHETFLVPDADSFNLPELVVA